MINLLTILFFHSVLKINNLSTNLEQTGIDHRYVNITDLNYEQLHNIEINFYKNDVLQTLENPNTPTVCKMILIDEYYNDFLCKPTINLHAGGLFNDWNFDI